MITYVNVLRLQWQTRILRCENSNFSFQMITFMALIATGTLPIYFV